ncbi:adenine deaminase [Clostridiales bacterium PH28_bin88]|nr:adenine deaminase [Clostridiales bacterium PH28_bin88]
MQIKDMILYATGKKPPELVLKNGKVINVFSGEIYEADVAMAGGLIVGIGRYSGQEEQDLAGKYICPGLMDGHMHLESSMVTPVQLARAVVPHGTTTIVTDPHEIANVCGERGIKYVLDATEDLPLSVYVMLPSCVPATPMEDNGATLDANALLPWYNHPRVLGLAEMMNYPGILSGDGEVLLKVEHARRLKKPVDGHAPGLTVKDLAGYIAAGINSDHECTTAEEALEKIRLGQWVMIREGTASKNLKDLLPVVTPVTSRRCFLVTDDCHPEDLLHRGHMDRLIRMLIRQGTEPVQAIQMATINTATYFGLEETGAIAPGFRADVLVLSNLQDFAVEAVYKEGRLVASQGRADFAEVIVDDQAVRNTFAMPEITSDMLSIEAKGQKALVIGLVPNQIITREMFFDTIPVNNQIEPNVEQDLLKVVVIERHRHTGKLGVGLVHGYGLKRGAVASSIAHDSHNLIVTGVDDEDICLAANVVRKNQGGLAVVCDGKVLGELPLPIAGLMTDADIAAVSNKMERLKQLAGELGACQDIDPFMTLAFLSLPVIPEIRITPRGLVRVRDQELVSVSL